MNTQACFVLLLLSFEGALMLLVPHISPRRFLFAVSVPPGFRATELARRAFRRYHLEVLAAVAAAAVVALWAQSSEAAFAAAAALPVLGAMAALVRERAKVRRIAGPAPDVREAAVSADSDTLPPWFFLSLAPFLAPAVTALYLRAHWGQLPARIPVHFGLNGPDRWADKSAASVYGVEVFGEGMMLVMMLIALGTFYGARTAPQRKVILKILVTLIYMLAAIISIIGVQPLHGFAPGWVFVPVVAFIAAAVVWSYGAVSDPRSPSDVTPDECWYLGQIYVNSQDPATFVQKRFGFGYTLNFGNARAWAILAGLVAALAGLALLAWSTSR